MEETNDKKLKGGKKEMDEITERIYREICPHCNKEFTSLYKDQLGYNFRLHLESCKKKNLSEQENDKE